MQTSTNAGPAFTFQPDAPSRARQAKILARSIFKDLKTYGISNDQILEVASQLIGQVTADLEDDEKDA